MPNPWGPLKTLGLPTRYSSFDKSPIYDFTINGKNEITYVSPQKVFDILYTMSLLNLRLCLYS